MNKLQSEDIDWIESSAFAIVRRSDNKVEVQTDSFVILNDKAFTQVGPYCYTSIHHYQVTRGLSK